MKRISFVLITAFFLSSLSGCSVSIDEKITRLHVIANSDSPEDQALKLKVKDSIVKAAEGCSSNSECSGDVFLSSLDAAAKKTVNEAGYDYPVRTEYTRMYFETREYDGFTIPAGMYNAVRVIIGEGEGKNWWCVIFPPLCNAAAEGRLDEEALKAGFTAEELALIKGERDGIIVRFKFVELWNRLMSLFE